jgi:hypothetical protein
MGAELRPGERGLVSTRAAPENGDTLLALELEGHASIVSDGQRRQCVVPPDETGPRPT